MHTTGGLIAEQLFLPRNRTNPSPSHGLWNRGRGSRYLLGALSRDARFLTLYKFYVLVPSVAIIPSWRVYEYSTALRVDLTSR